MKWKCARGWVGLGWCDAQENGWKSDSINFWMGNPTLEGVELRRQKGNPSKKEGHFGQSGTKGNE